MKNLGNLRPAKGSNQKKKRLGRGIGSGLGKTAGRGHKGQGQRKSGNVRPGFEGGQMPIYRHLPKRGFKNSSRTEYDVITLNDLNKCQSQQINLDVMRAAGILEKGSLPVKLLNNGQLTLKAPFTVTLHKVTAGARSAVEKAGGNIEEI